MSERSQRPSDVMGALPHRRPNRRSDKRVKPAKTAEPPPAKTAEPQAAKTAEPPPAVAGGKEIVGTMVQAAAELAEIGLSATARAVREAVARLPRP